MSSPFLTAGLRQHLEMRLLAKCKCVLARVSHSNLPQTPSLFADRGRFAISEIALF